MSEMAFRCGLSRARFYDLIKSGVMPPPCHDMRTRRPLYPSDLQEMCLQIRRTNTAFDGTYVLFNNRRSPTPKPAGRPQLLRPSVLAPVVDVHFAELADGLRALGITAADEKIKTAAAMCYPGGLPERELDAAMSTIFRHLRRTNAA